MVAAVSEPERVLMPTAEEIRLQEIKAKMQPMLRDEVEVIRQRADAALRNKASSDDARYFALIAKDYVELRLQHAQAVDNLTTVQERCDELLDDLRLLKVRLSLPKEE